MNNFSGLQFTIIYKRFFDKITNAIFSDTDLADMKIAKLSERKFFIHPFISVQKEFGYSDVTPVNNRSGRVDHLFDSASVTIKYINEVSDFYKQIEKDVIQVDNVIPYENIFIPTYVINLPERTDRLIHIKKQFEGRREFDVNIIEAIKHEKGNLGLWLTIRKIIQQALKNEDDIIIICEDDHEFTPHYTKNNFLKDVIEAHNLGIGILLGGIGHFRNASLVKEGAFWIDSFYCTQFTVIYKSLFSRILDETFDDKVTADGVFSQITSNKMVTFPFISTQKYLGHSNINIANNEEGHLQKGFERSYIQLEKLNEITKLYQTKTSSMV